MAMNELIFSSTINIFFNFPYYPAVRFYHLSGTVFFFREQNTLRKIRPRLPKDEDGTKFP